MNHHQLSQPIGLPGPLLSCAQIAQVWRRDSSVFAPPPTLHNG